MYYMLKKEKINPTYVSKDDSKHEKQVILLTIQDKEKLHYLEVKKSLLLRRIWWRFLLSELSSLVETKNKI